MNTHTHYEVRNANDDAVVYAAFQHALQALRYWRDRGQKGALVKVDDVYDEVGGYERYEERLIN